MPERPREEFQNVPRPQEEVRARLEQLMQQSYELLPPPPPGERPKPMRVQAPRSEMWRFLVSAIQTVRATCGPDSPHARELERCRDAFAASQGVLDLDTCRGALLAAKDDLEAGMLADLRQLVTAEAFGDLLEGAVHLLEAGHPLPAAAVAGAVLESSLRALASSRGVAWTPPSGINKLNTALYSARVYDKVVFGEVEAWAKLRNKVDHGDFTTPSEIDIGMVQRMVDGTRHFTLRYR